MFTEWTFGATSSLRWTAAAANLSSHKSKTMGPSHRVGGASAWFLPAYAPGLNPIKKR